MKFAAERQNELLEVLRTSSAVDVALGTVGDVDLAGIQILLSARMSALTQGKRLRLSQPPAGGFAAMLERGGLLACEDLRDFWRLDEDL